MRHRLLLASLTAVFSFAAASQLSAASLTLAWDASPGVDGYVVRYGTRSAPLSDEVTVGAQTTYTFTNLTDNTVYCFVVYSRVKTLVSPGSNQVCALVDPPPGLAETSDFNTDGHYDLVWQHQVTGHISAWMMNGTRMMASVLFSPGRVADTNWKIVGRGDMNGDGMTDLVWQHETEGWLSVWLMNGIGMYSSVLITPNRVPDTEWKIVGVADANGDGKADLYWQHRTTGALSIWLMNGLTMSDSLSLSPDRAGDLGWRVVGVADMNSDGFPDLVWQHDTTGMLSVWHLRGSRVLDYALLSPGQVPDTNWKVRAVGDLDGDGRPDLIWQHQVAGLLSAWMMTGSSMRSSPLLTPTTVGDTNWMIVR